MEQIYSRFRLLRKKISRSELALRLMGPPEHREAGAGPGVIMLQVDGLSFSQLQNGLSRGRLPFIRSLIKKHNFNLKPFYAGVPSTTPAVQGELFFGVKTAVPAFEFMDRERQKRLVMYYAASAGHVAEEMARTGGPALLEKGSSYSNIYSGGASEARYCAETMNLENLLQTLKPFRFLVLALLHFVKGLRVLGVSMVELLIAFFDFFKGLKDGKNFLKELKFIPSRVFICIVLRELIRFRVKMDLARGVPIIHANFTGYDEQAHRRGPESAFAHWTLKGIDGVIQDIYRAALRSDQPVYRFILFSDHGQETVRTWGYGSEKTLKQALADAYFTVVPAEKQSSGSGNRNGWEYLYAPAGNLWERILHGVRQNQARHPESSLTM